MQCLQDVAAAVLLGGYEGRHLGPALLGVAVVGRCSKAGGDDGMERAEIDGATCEGAILYSQELD
jgi:hypothetical protein